MIVPPGFDAAIVAALARARDRAAVMLAEEMPADVRVTPVAAGIRIRGHALARRALADARLRDLAGLIR